MYKSAVKTSLVKKQGLTIRILVVCVIAFAIVIPTINYAVAANNYYINLPMKKERVDGVPIVLRRLPFKVKPEDPEFNPNDWDADGLSNEEEILYNTNPNYNDTDFDRILDGAEVHVYHTTPSVSDSDGDFICDYDELFVYFTNPNKKDTDEDGLDDGMEIFVYLSSPFIRDTDYDNLDDYDEVHIYATDVNNRDTDSDGIIDGDEIHYYSTNPCLLDTDKDGLDDYWEIHNNHNPLVRDNVGRILGYYVVLPSLAILIVIIGIVGSVSSQQKYLFRFMEPAGYIDPKLKDKQYIFELISLMPKDKQISVDDLMEITGLTKYEVQQLLLTFFDDENYDESSLEDCVIYTTPESCLNLFTCFYCGSSITKNMIVCPNCDEEIVRCALCNMPIEYRDSYATCTIGGVCGTDKSITGYLAIEHLCTACTMRSKYDFV